MIVEPEPPVKLLDDLFKKTQALPCIYWLPLTDEQVLHSLVRDRCQLLDLDCAYNQAFDAQVVERKKKKEEEVAAYEKAREERRKARVEEQEALTKEKQRKADERRREIEERARKVRIILLLVVHINLRYHSDLMRAWQLVTAA